MKLTRKQASKLGQIVSTAAFVVLLASCQNPAANPQHTYTNDPAQVVKQSTDGPDSPQKTYTEPNNPSAVTDEPQTNHADTSGDTNAEASSIHSKNNEKATVKTESGEAKWDASKPAILGLAIGDDKAKASKLLGKELDSYKLEDETGSVTVYEYDGFAVGINSGKTVQFVEVYNEGITTGLSGLRIGDTPETAVSLLGKPEKQTSYLLSYKAETAWLKLDLDPEQNEIVSIKLLATSE